MLETFAEPEFWVAVAFVMLVAVFVYLGVHRTVLTTLDHRRDRIKAELDDARRLKEDAAKLLADYKAKRATAEREADEIISNAGDAWHYGKKGFAPYQIEHADLIASIRDGKPLNEAQQIAESTMTGILAREACYSGQEIKWDDAMKSTFVRGPKEVKFGPYEIEAVAKPGTYHFS